MFHQLCKFLFIDEIIISQNRDQVKPYPVNNRKYSFYIAKCLQALRLAFCNVTVSAYYDSFWLVTRTHFLKGWARRPFKKRNNLLNRIFIIRERMTLCLPNAKFKEKPVSPLLSYCNKNKHSWLYRFAQYSATLILYQKKGLSQKLFRKRMTQPLFDNIWTVICVLKQH